MKAAEAGRSAELVEALMASFREGAKPGETSEVDAFIADEIEAFGPFVPKTRADFPNSTAGVDVAITVGRRR